MRFVLSSYALAITALSLSLAQADDSKGSNLRVKDDQPRRSLMPFMTYDDKTVWQGDAGTTSWEADFSVDSNQDFRNQAVDVESTDGNIVFSLKTNGDTTGIAADNFKINAGTDRARIRVALTEPTVTMTFNQPVKAWGADLSSASDAGGLDIEIEVVCPGGNIDLPLNDPFTGFVLMEQAASAIIFRQGSGSTTSTANTVYMDNVVAVTGTKTSFGGGDPHFITWGNHFFDFMGECDLVLLHVANFENDLDLTIHVRTTMRREYSFITSAAVQIGDAILEVASYGEYFLNGVNLATTGALSMELEGFAVVHEKVNKKRDKFDIIIGASENITIAVHKDLVSVTIADGTPEHFGNSVGLMGNFHTGQMLSRDGKTVMEDEVAFGQEWQVHHEPQIFQAARAPQYPKETCRLPSQSDMQLRRRLGENKASQAAAEEACAHVSDADMKKACIYDVKATGDVDLASGY